MLKDTEDRDDDKAMTQQEFINSLEEKDQTNKFMRDIIGQNDQ